MLVYILIYIGDKAKKFDLFSTRCEFTDDSVMTIAIGKALLAAGCLYDSIEKTEMWQEQLSVQYIWQEMVLQKK